MDNHHIVDATLDRLCDQIGPLPPLLHSWKPLKNGRVRCELAGLWLDPPYKYVPWPFPQSATALALYLFLHGIGTSAMNKSTISLKSLCYKLGITTKWGRTKSRSILHKALDAVNDHLDTLDSGILRQYNITLPGHYEIIAEDGRVRFQAMPRQQPDDDADIEFVPSRQRQRPKIKPSEPRPRIIKKPRFTHEMLMRQVEQDRRNANTKPMPTRMYFDTIKDKHGNESVVIKRVVPMTEEEEARTLGRIDPDA
jgi:hypothetical protein